MTDDLIRSENFRGRNILAENMMVIAMTPDYVNRHKCYGIGFTILELSKLQMHGKWKKFSCTKN